MLLLFSEMKVAETCYLCYYTCCFNSLHFGGRTSSLGSVCREKLCNRDLPWAQPWPWCLPVGQQWLQLKDTEVFLLVLNSHCWLRVQVRKYGSMKKKTVLAKMCRFKQLDIPKKTRGSGSANYDMDNPIDFIYASSFCTSLMIFRVLSSVCACWTSNLCLANMLAAKFS